MEKLTAFGEDTDVLKPIKEKENRKYQDSFFKSLFKEPKYQKILYEELHPEDAEDLKESDFENIELENIFTIDVYNDVCFRVKNHLIVLMEHQSSLNPNMPIRMLLYLAEEYKRIITNSKKWGAILSQNLVKLPTPEMYIVYTGNKNIPTKLSIKDAFLSENTSDFKLSLDIPVYTIHNSIGVLGEFTSMIYEIKECVLQKDISILKAVEEVVKKYSSGFIISDFLSEKEDVIDMMNQQFTWEELQEMKLQSEVEYAVEEATQQVTQQVTQQAMKITYDTLCDAGISAEKAISLTAEKYNVTIQELKKIIEQ